MVAIPINMLTSMGTPTATAIPTATTMVVNTPTNIPTSTTTPTFTSTHILINTPPGAGMPITIMSTMTSAMRSNRTTTATPATSCTAASATTPTMGTTMVKRLSRKLAITVAAAALLSACAGGEAPQATDSTRVNAAAGALPPSQAATMPTAKAASQVAADAKAEPPKAAEPAKAEQKNEDAKPAVGKAGENKATDAAKVAVPQPDLGEGLFTTYEIKKGDDLLEIARTFSLGYLELKAANPEVDPWLPVVGHKIRIPSIHLLAAKVDTGLMINLAQMRLYRFDKGALVETYPLGIGREGLETPVGMTTVLRKAKDPTWYPTERMRREKPELPAAVGPGPQNPLGNRAIYLGWALYRIHGTNIPWGVGRRTSSGCLRMYPENVERLFEHINPGIAVKVVNDRVIVEWRDGRLWMSAYPTADGWDALEYNEPMPDMPLTTDMVAMITHAVPDGTKIHWDKVTQAMKDLRGYPVPVTDAPPSSAPVAAAPAAPAAPVQATPAVPAPAPQEKAQDKAPQTTANPS